MKYSAKTKPGMGDPYWYEWSVGQQYIIDMLNPDNNIKCVELQANVKLGLDDVVVTYEGGEKLFVQVKHTRSNKTLTFGDLVSIDNTSEDGSHRYSLLGELAQSWIAEKNNYQKTRVCLSTNRKPGIKVSSAGKEKEIKRPALKLFLEELKSKIIYVETFDELEFPEYEVAWNEWKEQLNYIEKAEDKLLFLKCLEIETNQIGLEEIKEDLLQRLQAVFHTKRNIAELLLAKLDHALRGWTTSGRNSSCVTIEDVYMELALDEDTISYNHDLIAAEPFFTSRDTLVDDLEIELKNGNSRVVFLSGIPGTGKTNIVSKISGKRNSIVNIRYYAYEPIDPMKEYLPMDVSKRVEKETFWNELFCQLRRLLKGQLKKYEVPVINGFMALEEMREHFFKIASKYAADNNSIFVIAIDGIDHAARAGYTSETFLASLPNPEYVPSNVKILLAGQPKEAYKNYPLWLYEKSDNLKEVFVPPLQIDDILELVKSKFPEKTLIYQQQLTGLIDKYAQGNTLAAIFAVHEAIQHPDPVELEKQLQNRKLGGNIQEYYKTIWDDAKRNMKVPFVDYKMAGVFAFFNEPINAVKLSEIFPHEHISVSGWNNVLKALSPLLIANDDNYTILHNDIRVYLSGIIGRDMDNVQEVYSGLCDYYLNLKEKSRAYYSDIIRYLKLAGRENEFTKVYSADYIISAYVHGVEINELREISQDILEYIISGQPINWEYMRCLAFGYMTIDQIEKSSYEIEDTNFRKSLAPLNIHPYECYVQSESLWNIDILETVIALTRRLYVHGESSRATALFKNWFSKMNILQIYAYLEPQNKDKNFLSPDLQSIASNLAECICHSGEVSILQGTRNLFDIDEHFSRHFVKALIENFFVFLSGQQLQNAVSSLEVVFIEPLIVGVKRLLDKNRYDDIKRVENILHDRLFKGDMGILLSIFMQIVSSRKRWTPEYKEKIWGQIKDIELPDHQYENLMTYYSIYALVAAYLQPTSRTSIVSAITERYMEKHQHNNRSYFGMYFNNICLIGKWLCAKHTGTELLENAADLKQLMTALFIKKWKPNDRDFETIGLRPYIMKAYIILSRCESHIFRKIVDNICETVFSTNPVNQLLEAGIFYYQNDKERITDWFNEWLSDDGLVWNESIGDRNRIIQDFCVVKEKYDTCNSIDMSNALKKASWSVIGYASHKEYSADYLLRWYNKLIEYDDKYIYEYARTVKDISDKMELVGDNRLEYILNCKIFADLFSGGYSNIKELLQDNHYLAQGLEQPTYFVDGLIGFLKKAQLKESELLSMWAIGMGLLDWRSEDNHAVIHSLQRAIELCAERTANNSVFDTIREYGAAYIDLVSDPIKYIIPDRWCDAKKTEPINAISIEEVKQYLANDDSVNQSELKNNIEILIRRNEMPKEVLNELLIHEFEKETSSIQHSSFLEYLVSKSEAEISDQIICEYLRNVLGRDHYYLELDLPELVCWKIHHQGEAYCKAGLEEVIKMQRSWMTAAGHFKEPEIQQEYDYCQLIHWNKVDNVESLFYQILKILILSEDADAAYIALTGLFALLRSDAKYLKNVEDDWEEYHYRAKEWLMMLYELLWHLDYGSRNSLYEIIKRHCKDDDFNVALYANIMLETLWSDQFDGYFIEKKDFFNEISVQGFKKLIKTKRNTPWINGYDCVLEMKERLEKCFGTDLEDLEERTADYVSDLSELSELIKLNRSFSSCRVVLDKVNKAFFRVLYKDWESGRWDGVENELARIVLSSSEPYTLLITPRHWAENNGVLIDQVDGFQKLGEDVQKSKIKELLEVGISDDHMVIAGTVVDYTYKQEMMAFMLTYLNIPGMKPEYAAYTYERNSRVILQMREDFFEEKHFNISIHYNGIESFKHSNIMCGLSKTALLAFGWHIEVGVNGMKLFDERGEQIGWFEHYCGSRSDMGNRYQRNQPYMQRWIVQKEKLDKSMREAGIPHSVERVVDFCIQDYE